MLASVDHYRRLGVARTASLAEIRMAFRARIRELHPDGASAGDAAQVAAVTDAWHVLRDPGARAAYDRTLAGDAAGVAPPTAGPPTAGPPTAGTVSARSWRAVVVGVAVLVMVMMVAIVLIGFTQGPGRATGP